MHTAETQRNFEGVKHDPNHIEEVHIQLSSAAPRRSPEEHSQRVFERIKVGLVSNFLLNPHTTFIREEQS